jgi:hypothetical protein
VSIWRKEKTEKTKIVLFTGDFIDFNPLPFRSCCGKDSSHETLRKREEKNKQTKKQVERIQLVNEKRASPKKIKREKFSGYVKKQKLGDNKSDDVTNFCVSFSK